MKRFKKLLTMLLLALFGVWGLSATAQTYSVTVIQPNGGENWAVGTSHLISWTDNLSKPVKIMLSVNGGAYQVISGASSVEGSTWVWNISSSQTTGTARIKVVSTIDGSIDDESDADFNLVSSGYGHDIHVESPNGGESWVRGTTHLISWTSSLQNETFDIELVHYDNSTPNQIDHTYPIATDVSGSTYSWTIDSQRALGAHYIIRVTGHTNTGVTDVSDQYFSITDMSSAATVTLIQPNGNEQWVRGSQHLISWTGNLGTETYDLYLDHYNVNNHKDATYTIATDVPASTYTWTINSSRALGANYKVRITGHTHTSVVDTSDNYFAITDIPSGAAINLIQPSDNGISWVRGTQHLISWTGNLGTETYDLYLDHYNVNNHKDATYTIATDVPASTYTWTINSSRALGANYKVRITGHTHTSVVDTSDNYFAITDIPAGAEINVIQPSISGISWARGTQHLISWTGNLGAETYDLYLDHYNVNNHKDATYTIATDVPASTYTWTINSSRALGANYKVRITGHSHSAIVDTSDNYFAITDIPAGAFTRLIQPNGGEHWVRGMQYLISWTGNLGTETYDLYLDHYNVNNHKDVTYTIATDVPASTYTWTINSSRALGANYKVRITGHSHSAIVDTSDNYFSITDTPQGGKITVVQPNGGENWAQGTQHLLSWTMENMPSDETYDIYLHHYYGSGQLDNTASYTYLIASNVSPSTYTWNISSTQYTGNNYRIYIKGHQHPAVADSSDSYFHIILAAKIDVYPNPSTTSVTVQFNENSNEHYVMTLYNRYNMRVMTKPVNTSTTKQVRINTFNLPNGVYFLRLVSGKEVISKKIVVQH